MRPQKHSLAFVGLLLCSLAVPVGFGVADAAPANVAIANVTATPDQPAPGEQFTVSTTIRNAQNSEAFRVDRVYLQTRGGVTKSRINDPGTIPVGSSMTIPLTLSIGDTGSQSLRVVVYGESESGESRRLEYPLSVTVREGGPQLELDVGESAVGAPTPVTVTVSNGEESAVRNLDVRLRGDAFDTEGTRRINATLASGGERSFSLSPVPNQAGTHNLTAIFRFTTATGANRVIRETRRVDVNRLREDVTVSARVAEANGTVALPVRVQNFGNAPITNVVVTASDNGTLVTRESAGTIEPNTTGTIQLPLDGVEGDSIDVTADYRIADQHGSAVTSVEYESTPGSIDLTGVDFERDGDVYRITGSASNLGLSDVHSALVGVQSADGVQPRGPSKEYFVGTVEASDFITFELTAHLDEGVTDVPIRLSYLVDGERITRTVVVERDAPASGSGSKSDGAGSDSNENSGGLLIPALVTLGVLAVFIAVAVVLVRRYDDGD